jgi:hypothetical protein
MSLRKDLRTSARGGFEDPSVPEGGPPRGFRAPELDAALPFLTHYVVILNESAAADDAPFASRMPLRDEGSAFAFPQPPASSLQSPEPAG